MNMNTLNFQKYEYEYGYKITVYPRIRLFYKIIHKCIDEYFLDNVVASDLNIDFAVYVFKM